MHFPTCNRPLLSRRIPRCSFCQAPIPAELLFTPAEIAKIEAEEKARELAAIQRDEKRAEEAAKARSVNDCGGAFFMIGDSGGF